MAFDIRIDASKRDPLDNLRGPRMRAPRKRGPKPGSKMKPRDVLRVGKRRPLR